MPFDPALPKTDSEMKSAEMRSQFTSLKALIDDLAARVAALEHPPVSGRRGVIFNGLDNYAVNPAIAWPAAGTWEFWIKVTGTINDLWPGVAGDGSGLAGTDFNVTGLPGFEFYSGPNSLYLVAFGTAALWSNTADWSQWHHLALTWDPAASPKVRLFVDGVPVASHDTLNIPVSSPAPLQLGYPTRPNTGVQMALASVRLSGVIRYTAAFTPADSYVPDAGTVALYEFAEQTGLTIGDSSGHGNDLTLATLPSGTLPVWFG
jgi:hypothetical protein